MAEELLPQYVIAKRAAFNLVAADETFVFELATSSALPNLLAASASNFTIKLYDRNTLAITQVLNGHKDRISRITFASSVNSQLPHTLVSSSEDGYINMWDVRASATTTASSMSSLSAASSFSSSSAVVGQFHHKGDRFTSMDVSNDGSLIVAGTEVRGDDDANIVIFDVRAGKVLDVFSESHTNDITCVKFHPQSSSTFLTASEDGLVCLFDLNANMSSEIPDDMVIEDEVTTEENKLVSIMNANASIHNVGFFGPSGEFVYGITGSQSLGMWHGAEAKQLAFFQSPRTAIEGISMDYLISCQYHPATQRLYMVAGDNMGSMHVLHVGLQSIEYIQTLQGAHSSTVRCVDWDIDSHNLFSCGEDAMLCKWTFAGNNDPMLSPQFQSQTTAPFGSRSTLPLNPLKKL